MQRDKILGVGSCAAIFAFGLLGATYFYKDSMAIALVCVIGGTILGLLCLFVIVGDQSKGKVSIDLKNQKGKLEWQVRQKEPFDTISSTAPTNSTSAKDAIVACNMGRKVLNEHGDLDTAYKYFSDAVALDPNYWEPKANIAGIHLINGELDRAYQLAREVRKLAISSNNNLAFANASLIMASVMETNIDPMITDPEKRQEYNKIVAVLEEALRRSPEDVVVRSAKIKTQIIGGFAREEVVSEILSIRNDRKFIEELAAALNSDEKLKSAFVEELPEAAQAIFPVDQP